MIRLSIIIVSYNVKPFLEQALHSVRKALLGIPSEVFVVDNGSGDGSVQLVREHFPEVCLIVNRENLGFARANNMALRKAKGDAICLLNPDTLVREDTFRVCIEYLNSHAEVGAVGCKILNPDGSLQLACRRSFPTPWVAFTKVIGLSRLFPGSRVFGKYNLTYLDSNEVAEVDSLSGSFMMVKQKVIKHVGLLDEIFFLYGEDLDWCYRIRQKGWKVVYLPDTQIIHYKGQSTKEAPFDSLRVFYGAMRLFVKKHYKSGWSWVPQRVLLLGILVRGGISFLSRIAGCLVVPLIDLIFLQMALFFGILIRFGNLDYWIRYLVVNCVYTFVWLGCLYIMGLYKRGNYSSSRALVGVIVGLILNTSLTFFLPQYAFSRYVVLITGALDIVFISGWRLLIRLASRVRLIPFLGTVGKTLIRRRVLIVGTDSYSRQIAARLRSRVDAGYDVIGFLGLEDKDLLSTTDLKIPVFGILDDLERIVSTHKIQEIIFSPQVASYERVLTVVAGCRGIHVDIKMVPQNLDVIIGRTSIEILDDIPLVNLDYRIFYGYNRFFKRTVDILFALLLSSIFSPICLYLIINPRYRFHRSLIFDGIGRCISVRELFVNGKPVTGLLRFIPLLLEVLKGNISVVGTEILQYQESKRAEATGFKPGLTGLVQVNRDRIFNSAERKRYNMYYLKNYSLLLDLEIVLKALFNL
jgi:GT2 family glycosyltransferase/lipopolysaccharide/colanic/teichoic acid biosynthesis glycosyltransferase